MKSFQRILCIRTDRIGDMFVSTPALRALRRAFPAARLDVLASASNAPVLRNNPNINRCLVFDRGKPLAWPRLALNLRRQKYDLVLVFSGSSSTSAWLARICHSPDVFAVAQTPRKGFYTRQFIPTPGTHQITRLLDFVAELGAQSQGTDMDFFVPQQNRDAVNALFPPQAGLRRVGIFIGNQGKQLSRWPVEKFLALTKKLLEQATLQICILAGPDDSALLQAFDRQQHERLLRYQSSVLENSAALIQTCDLFITSSSSPQHLAAAIGTPCLSIMYPLNALEWAPLGPQHQMAISDLEGDVRGIPLDDVHALALKMLSGIGEGTNRA